MAVKTKQSVKAAPTATKKAAPAKATTKAAPAKAKKEEPVRQGLTTKEAAEELSKRLGTEITPVRLRRLLRTDDFVNDGGYTRYDLTPDVIDSLEVALKAGASPEGGTKRGRKAKSEADEEEAPSELDDLEEGDEEEEEEEESDDEMEDLEEDDEEEDDEEEEE